jgi:CheY-like chemotaxis protein
LTILVAEDNPVNQKFTLTVLEKAGHQAHLAENGQEAVDLAAKHPFDLVLMDVQMPVMDGLAATRQLRSQGFAPPIIAMTAHANQQFLDMAIASGMNACITKPVTGEKLLRTLDDIAARRHTPPAAEAPPPAAMVFNLENALNISGGDVELLRDMVRMVLQQAEEDLPGLREACAARDAVHLRERAHRLKGSMGTIGAEAAHAACLQMEYAARDGKTETFDDALAVLENALQQQAPVLQKFLNEPL